MAAKSYMGPIQQVLVTGGAGFLRQYVVRSLQERGCKEIMVLRRRQYDAPDPVNIGAGFEISIKDLVSLIVQLTGFQGRIVWDTTKPNGQQRRSLDTSRAWELFGFAAKTDLRVGLRHTVDWYRENRGTR